MKAANRDPWPFSSQCAAAGLEAPIIVKHGWRFPIARLFAHVCQAKVCIDCRAAMMAGWFTVRLTEADVTNGKGLDKVAAALRRPTGQGSLF